MLEASPVTASIAVTSLAVIASAVMPALGGDIAVLALRLPHAAEPKRSPAIDHHHQSHLFGSGSQQSPPQKRGCRRIPAASSNSNASVEGGVEITSRWFRRRWRRPHWHPSTYWRPWSWSRSVAFMSIVAFMSVSIAMFSSMFIVLLAASLLLQAETARAAPATRIRARIQNSLIIAICSGLPAYKSRDS